ncbi:MAG: ATP-grasp domain-containing protein [Synechococcaceae cyanobacterium]|nr:ATP-grasp domain-containing protein [Synechococcaceae cyanobacterium]
MEIPSAPSLPLGGIGIVGGGQLALMLAEAAAALGLELHVQTPQADDPAVGLATSTVLAPLHDAQATAALARRCGAISFENEWLPLEPLRPLAQAGVTFAPSLDALAPLVSKRSQRQLLQDLHLPTPRWCPLEAVLAPLPDPGDDEDPPHGGAAPTPSPSLASAAASGSGVAPAPVADPQPRLPEGFSFPVMAKASRGGYDGRGTRCLADLEALQQLLAAVEPADWILEEQVPFACELALTACRDRQGNLACFPLVQTHQHRHVCDWVLYPAPVDHAVRSFGRNVAASLLTALDYVGVLTVEFFWGPHGLQVNELAPRTHNSGHLTIEAFRHSQFEQQLRAVAGLPLGLIEPQLEGALMVNLLGLRNDDPDHAAERRALEQLEGARLHWYGKRGGGVGRKLGHITLPLRGSTEAEREDQRRRRLAEVRAIWPLQPGD